MWQRRVLQPELGGANTLIQLSLDALRRFTAAQPGGAGPQVSYDLTGAGTATIGTIGTANFTSFLPPGTHWSLSSTQRRASVTGLVLIGLDRDVTGNARARWSISFAGFDERRSSRGKLLFGGIQAETPLGELVQQYEGLYGRRGPGLIASDVGKPVTTASTTTNTTWTATAELTTPLKATVNSNNGAVTVGADLAGATLTGLSSPSFDANGDADLQMQLASRLAALLAGRVPAICPQLSALGALNVNESAPEALPATAALRVAGTPGTALCLFLAPNAAPAIPAASTDLTAGGDVACIVNEAGMRKTIAFCMRTGRFPTHWADTVVPQAITNGSVNVSISNDIDTFTIDLMPYATNAARQEDFIAMQFTTRSTITDVRNPDGTPADPGIKPQLSAGQAITYSDMLYMSNVGTPAPKTDPQVEAWFQAWRAQVSRRFSIPFAAATTVTLLERTLNGVEKSMISRCNAAF